MQISNTQLNTNTSTYANRVATNINKSVISTEHNNATKPRYENNRYPQSHNTTKPRNENNRYQSHNNRKDRNSNEPPVVMMKKIKLDIQDAEIPTYVFNYIKNLIPVYPIKEIIAMTKQIGIHKNDKLICLTNLFMACVRRNNIALMQAIIKDIGQQDLDRLFMVNAFDHKYTPIMHACYNGSLEAFKLLLIWGANADIINVDNEDIVSATNSGLRDALVKQSSMAIFLTAQYNDILKYIEFWRKSRGNIEENNNHIEVEVVLNNDTVPSKFVLINVKSNIIEQIKELLELYIANSNTGKMEQLFTEIQELINNNYCQFDIIHNILLKYENELNEDFDTIYNIFKIQHIN